MIITDILFYVFSAVLVFSAIRVITVSSPVTAAMHLILGFFTAAMIWMLLKAEFLSILLVLVYVGAVMVLLLFVVMMLDIDTKLLRKGFHTYLPLGLIIAAIMVGEMIAVLGGVYFNRDLVAVAQPEGFNNTRAVGELLYTQYGYAIQVAGAILLVAMIAAIAITLRGAPRKGLKRNDPSEQIRVRKKDRLTIVSMPAEAKESTTETASKEGETA